MYYDVCLNFNIPDIIVVEEIIILEPVWKRLVPLTFCVGVSTITFTQLLKLCVVVAKSRTETIEIMWKLMTINLGIHLYDCSQYSLNP